MQPPSLVAVVVTYNRLDQLQVTLARLLDSPSLTAVVVLDNASTDGTGTWLEAQADPRLHVITSATNLGGAGGFETAMRAVSDRFDPDWMVLMDDDARPAPGALARFTDTPRTSHSAWAAAVYYPDGTACDMNRPWINPFRSLADLWHSLRHGRDGFHLNEEDYAAPAPRDIDGASFVGLFLSRDAVARAGYPDGRLFLYGDDVLYTLALSQSGGRVGFDPALHFEHDCATLSATSPVMQPLWKVYYFHRNQLLVYRQAAGPVLFWPVAALRIALWRMRARAYGDRAATYRRLLGWAIRDGLRQRLDRPHLDILTEATEKTI